MTPRAPLKGPAHPAPGKPLALAACFPGEASFGSVAETVRRFGDYTHLIGAAISLFRACHRCGHWATGTTGAHTPGFQDASLAWRTQGTHRRVGATARVVTETLTPPTRPGAASGRGCSPLDRSRRPSTDERPFEAQGLFPNPPGRSPDRRDWNGRSGPRIR